jgi:NADH-quinone oxidoreductase subunit M
VDAATLMNGSPLHLLYLLPLLGIVAIVARAPARLTSLLCVVATLLLSGYLCLTMGAGDHFAFVQSVPWLEIPGFARITFSVGLDGMNAPLVLLTALVSLAALLMVPVGVVRAPEYFGCMLAIIAGLFGAFVSTDLFFIYLFHELALIPTFLMIGIWGNGSKRVGVAVQMAIYLLFGSLVLLAAIIGLMAVLPPEARTTELLALRSTLMAMPPGPESQQWLYPLFVVGFGVLVGLFPFHSWAPRGYAAAPAPVAMLHAGVLKKFGLYGLLRVVVGWFPDGAAYWDTLLYGLIAGNLIVLGYSAISQRRLDMTLGYSSVMHMGYLFLGLMAATHQAQTGAIVLMVGHGLSVAGLYAVAGSLQRRVGSLDYGELGGLGRRLPALAFVFSLFALASIGLPGLANFPGELLIFFGSWEELPYLTATALFGVLLSTIYMLRATRYVFFGKMIERSFDASPNTWRETVGFVVLAGALVVFGFAPSLLANAGANAIAAWFGGMTH